MANQSRKKWVRRPCFSVPSKRWLSLPQCQARKDHYFPEARDWSISAVVLYWVNLTKLELDFPELPSLCGSRVGLSKQIFVEHLEGESKAAASTLWRSVHSYGGCFNVCTLSPICWLSLFGWAPSSSSSCQFFSSSYSGQSVCPGLRSRVPALYFIVKVGSGRRQLGVPFVFRGSTLASLSPTSHPAFLLDFWPCW